MRAIIVAIMAIFISPFIMDRAPAETRAQTRQEAPIRFAAMDTNRDGVITRDEWRGSAQSFRVHDWNGDGVLSREEVRVGARPEAREGRPGTFEGYDREYPFDNWTAAGFTSLDHNKDGRITRDEWHYERESFNRADHNRDGALSRAEFLGSDDGVDDDRDDSFQNLDVNNDGRVSRDEWHGTSALFDALDIDRDGLLTRVEIAGTAEPPPDLFASLDVNRDGSLTWEEWHWTRPEFDARDRNKDGRITRDEADRTGGTTAQQNEVHRAGYERGLTDGRAAGRRDRVSNSGWFLEGRPELERADVGYEQRFKSLPIYQAGYRDGFRRGYREGYSQ